MIIYSTFRDYYDCGQATDADRSIIYHRKECEHKIPSIPQNMIWRSVVCSLPGYRKMCIVGFAGQIHVAAVLWNDDISNFEHHFSYDPSWQEIEDRRWGKCKMLCGNVKQDWDAWCEYAGQYQFLFEKYSTAIFSFLISEQHDDHLTVTINPTLRNYGFQRVRDPFTAYQTLREYWNNVAQPARPIPLMDDLTKASQHGHDGRYSFRKPPRNG